MLTELQSVVFLSHLQKVEIAIADIPLTADRQQHVEYTQPFLMDDLSVVVSRKSQAGKQNYTHLLKYTVA